MQWGLGAPVLHSEVLVVTHQLHSQLMMRTECTAAEPITKSLTADAASSPCEVIASGRTRSFPSHFLISERQFPTNEDGHTTTAREIAGFPDADCLSRVHMREIVVRVFLSKMERRLTSAMFVA